MSKYMIAYRAWDGLRPYTWNCAASRKADGVFAGLNTARAALAAEMRDTWSPADITPAKTAQPGVMVTFRTANNQRYDHAIFPVAAWKIMVSTGLAED